MPASSRRGGGWGHGAVSVPFHENYKKAAAPFWEESSEHGHSFQDDQGSRTGHLCVSRGAGGDTRRGLVTQVQGSRDPVGGQTSKITRNANGSEPSGSCLSPRNELLALEAKRPVAQASVCTGGGCVCKPSNQPPGPAMGQRHSQDHDSAAHTHTRLPTAPPTGCRQSRPAHPGGSMLLSSVAPDLASRHLPWRSARRDWPGGPCSGHSCRFGGSWADTLGKFWTWSSSPSRGTPGSAQGRRGRSCSSAGLSSRTNTGTRTPEPLLFGGCVAPSTPLG